MQDFLWVMIIYLQNPLVCGEGEEDKARGWTVADNKWQFVIKAASLPYYYLLDIILKYPSKIK